MIVSPESESTGGVLFCFAEVLSLVVFFVVCPLCALFCKVDLLCFFGGVDIDEVNRLDSWLLLVSVVVVSDVAVEESVSDSVVKEEPELVDDSLVIVDALFGEVDLL